MYTGISLGKITQKKGFGELSCIWKLSKEYQVCLAAAKYVISGPLGTQNSNFRKLIA